MKIEFGTHYLLTAKASERSRIRSFYKDILCCSLESHDHGVTESIPDNIDLFHFPQGIVVGVRYVAVAETTLDTREHKLASWMELKTDDTEALVGSLKKFGVEAIDFWDKNHFYFHAPGGQVFRIVELNSEA